MYFSLHFKHNFLANLCEITILNEEVISRGSTHKLINLCIVCVAEFVWIVEKTICPVIEASTASLAVSSSLISHTIIISGSCLNKLLSHLAKVKLIVGFICVWFTHLILYSTGSSKVDIFFSSGLYWASNANKLVDLPEPVGQTAKIIQ